MKKLLVIVVLMMTASTGLFAKEIDNNAWSFFNNVFGVPDAVDCTSVNQGDISLQDMSKLMYITKHSGSLSQDAIDAIWPQGTSTTLAQ